MIGSFVQIVRMVYKAFISTGGFILLHRKLHTQLINKLAAFYTNENHKIKNDKPYL